MSWKLYLDDERNPTEDGYVIVRNSLMAVIKVVEMGIPAFMSLDHDLGGDDTTMVFLRELYHLWEERGANPNDIPDYIVHSANPIGTKNIISFMDSWKKSASS